MENRSPATEPPAGPPAEVPTAPAARATPPAPVACREAAELEAGLAAVLASPRDRGRLALVVRRPAEDEREILAEGVLDPAHGLVGDTWAQRGSRRTADGAAHPDMQLNVINARFAALVAGSDRPEDWAPAGDQLFLDLDLGVEALPPGTRLAIGEAVIEVTDQPHTGCAKFAARYGRHAHALVWTEQGKRLRLRGLNARVVVGGTIRPGDAVVRLG